MKHYVKKIILSMAAFYAAYILVPTITLGTDPKNLLYILGGLFAISVVINPMFSLILLPLNLLTFGIFMFILHVGFIVGLIKFLPGFSVAAYAFPGLDIYGVIIPPFNFTQTMTIVLVATIITILQKFFDYVFE